MKYFTNCKNLEELRKEYKNLVKANHPDNGGSADEIKIINVEYEEAMKSLKNADETENAWKYDPEKDELFRDTLNKIINLEDALKAAGFKWCNNKKAWSWHAGERYYKKSKRKLSMDELRNLYGSEEITPHRNDRIA